MICVGYGKSCEARVVHFTLVCVCVALLAQLGSELATFHNGLFSGLWGVAAREWGSIAALVRSGAEAP